MSTVSGWFFDSDSSFGGGSDDGDDAIFPRGYDAILGVLRSGLDIRLGKAVTQISEDGSSQAAAVATQWRWWRRTDPSRAAR